MGSLEGISLLCCGGIVCPGGSRDQSLWFYVVHDYIFLCNRALCDSNGVGSLNREQFALAMYFIEEKSTKGMDPPAQLTPDMIPPSMRSASDPGTVGYLGFSDSRKYFST